MTNDLPANPYPLPDPATAGNEAQNMLSDEAQIRSQERQALPPAAPSFTLSARDLLAPILIRHWVELSKYDKNVKPWERERARKIALAMELWQKDQGMVPDAGSAR